MTRYARQLALGVVLAGCGSGAHAQCVSLTANGSASTQDFNTLANTAGSTTNTLGILGWFLSEAGGGARDNEQYAVDTGGSNTGDTYSYGAAGATDRALGTLRSGTVISTIGSCYTNNTGTTIRSIDVAYTGEEWRLGTISRADQLAFAYSLDATDLVTGAWTAVPALTFSTPNIAATGAKDGNDPANRSALSANIGSVSIANGATFWVRWTDADASGADDGLAIDDVSLTPRADGGGPVTPSASIADSAIAEGDSGSKPMFFTVTLTQPAGSGGVSIDYATADGTATAGSDYTATSGTLTIAAGLTTATFSVDITGDTSVEPNETFFVNLSNAVGATLTDAQAVGSISNDDVTVTPISAIQGTGQLSPIVGQTVTTRGIVTGRRNNGYYIQTPDGQDDVNPATSEGLYIFTNAAPPADAAVGNLVQVQGAIAEFVPAADAFQLPLTEIINSTVTVLGTGNTLPAPVTLTTSLPSPTGGIEQLEPFEGMRVTAPSLTVVEPTRGTTNEPNATGTSNGIFDVVVTGTPRPFREPGIQAPDPAPGGGMIPPIPRFDFNPEVLTVVSASLGAPVLTVPAGTVLTGMTGVLDYSFRHYTILPDPAVPTTVGTLPVPTPARLPTPDEFTVGSFNIERFFDTVNDPATSEPVLTASAFAGRLNKLSLAVRDFLNTPDIIGFMEVENLSTLQAAAAKINADAVATGAPDPNYLAFLEEGNDVGGIDVGFMVKSSEVATGTPRVEVVKVTQLGKAEVFTAPDGSTAPLNDRPPLQLDAVVHYADGRVFPITAIVVHQRSLNGANADTADGERIRVKRLRQAEYVARQVQALQEGDPARRVIVLGDFNAFEFNDGLTDVMGTVTGSPSPDNQTAVGGDGNDSVEPNLTNLSSKELPEQRYSYVFDGNAQSLDHVLVSQGLLASAADLGLDHGRIDADFPEFYRNDTNSPARLSDHDPAVAYIKARPLTFANLGVTASATPANVAAGGRLGYGVTIVNSGPDAADFPGAGFAIDAVLPDLAVTAPQGWSCDPAATTATTTSVACAATTLGNGGSAVFALAATAPAAAAGSTITLSASVSSQTTDVVTTNDNASAAATVDAGADLGVSVDGPTRVPFSTTPQPFTLRVGNQGPSAAADAAVQINVDTLRQYVTLAPPQGWTCVSAPERRFSARCSASAALASGSSADFAMTVLNRGRGAAVVYTIRGTATSAANDPAPANNTGRKTVISGGTR